MITPGEFQKQLGQGKRVFLSPQEFAMRHRVGGAAVAEQQSGVLPPLSRKPRPILQTAGAVGREVVTGTTGLVEDIRRSDPALAIPQTALALSAGIMGFADRTLAQGTEMFKQFASKGKIDPLAAKAVGDLREAFWHYEPTDPGAQVAVKFVAAIPAGVKMAFDVAADEAEKAGWSVNIVAGLRTAGDLAELGAFGRVFHSLRLRALKEQIAHPDVDMEAHFRSETVRQGGAERRQPAPAPLLKSRTGVYKGEKPKSAEELGVRIEERPKPPPSAPSPGQPKFTGVTPEQFRKGLEEKPAKRELSTLEKLVKSELPTAEVKPDKLSLISKGGKPLKSGVTQAEFLAEMKKEGKIPDTAERPKIEQPDVTPKIKLVEPIRKEMKNAEAFLSPPELLDFIRKGLQDYADIAMPRIEKYVDKMMKQAEDAGQSYNEGLHKSYITSGFKLYDRQRLGEFGEVLPIAKEYPKLGVVKPKEKKPIGELVPKAKYPFQPRPTRELASLTKKHKAKVETLITKPVREFHTKFMEEVDKGVEGIKKKVGGYENWKYDAGDKLKSSQTNKIYEITARSWDKRKNQPIYHYKSGEESGTFIADRVHSGKTLTLVKKPQLVKKIPGKIALLKASKKRVAEKKQTPQQFKESQAGIKEMKRGRQAYYDMLEYQQEVGHIPREKIKTVEDLARKVDEEPGMELYSGLPLHLLKEDALALARGLKKLKTKAEEKGIPFKDYLTSTVGFKPDVADKMMVVYEQKKYDLIPAEMEKIVKAVLKKPQTRRDFGRLMLNLVKSQLLMPALKGKAVEKLVKKTLVPSKIPISVRDVVTRGKGIEGVIENYWNSKKKSMDELENAFESEFLPRFLKDTKMDMAEANRISWEMEDGAISYGDMESSFLMSFLEKYGDRVRKFDPKEFADRTLRDQTLMEESMKLDETGTPENFVKAMANALESLEKEQKPRSPLDFLKDESGAIVIEFPKKKIKKKISGIETKSLEKLYKEKGGFTGLVKTSKGQVGFKLGPNSTLWPDVGGPEMVRALAEDIRKTPASHAKEVVQWAWRRLSDEKGSIEIRGGTEKLFYKKRIENLKEVPTKYLELVDKIIIPYYHTRGTLGKTGRLSEQSIMQASEVLGAEITPKEKLKASPEMTEFQGWTTDRVSNALKHLKRKKNDKLEKKLIFQALEDIIEDDGVISRRLSEISDELGWDRIDSWNTKIEDSLKGDTKLSGKYSGFNILDERGSIELGKGRGIFSRRRKAEDMAKAVKARELKKLKNLSDTALRKLDFPKAFHMKIAHTIRNTKTPEEAYKKALSKPKYPDEETKFITPDGTMLTYHYPEKVHTWMTKRDLETYNPTHETFDGILPQWENHGIARVYNNFGEVGIEIKNYPTGAQLKSFQVMADSAHDMYMDLYLGKKAYSVYLPEGPYDMKTEFPKLLKRKSFILLDQEGAISFGGRSRKARDMIRAVKAQRDRMLTPVAGNPLDIISTRFLKTEKIEDYIKLMPALGELKPNELFKIAPELRGEIAAVGKKKSPAIRASGFLTLKTFSDSVKKFKDVSKRDVMWADPTRGMQAIDQGQFAGPVQKHILWPARASMLAKLRWVDIQKHRMLGITEKYNINSKRKAKAVGDIMEYVGREDVNKTPAEILKRFTPIEVVKKHHGDIVRAAQETRKIYDDLIQWQNMARKKRGQKEIPYLEKYRRWVIETNIWNKYLNLRQKPEHVMEHPEMPDFILPDKPFVSHELARTGGLAKYPKERNIVRLTSDYIESAARDIFDTNVVHHNKIHSKVLKGRGLKNAAEFIDRWTAEVFAGVSPRITRAAKEIIPPVPRAVVLAIRRNLTRAVFPLNWTWNMFIQTSSSGLTYTRYGGVNSLKGLRGFVDSKFKKEIAANAYSHIIKSHRGGSPISQDLAVSLLRLDKLDATRIERVEAFANILTNVVEEALTRHAVGAAYYHGKELGLEGRALWEYASEGGAKTQSMYNFQDVPGILRSKETGAISPFQTFAIEVFNTVREMNVPVLNKIVGKTGTYETIAASSKQGKALASKRLGMIARWTAAMLVTNAVVDKAIGRKPWEISSFVPFLSLIIGGYAARGPVQQQYFQGWVKGIRSVYLYGNLRPLRKWYLHYHVPAGIQMERMISGITAVIEGEVKDASGKTQFKVKGFEEQLKAISGGVYRTEAGKAYVRKRRETQGIKGVIKMKKKRKKKPIGGLR